MHLSPRVTFGPRLALAFATALLCGSLPAAQRVTAVLTLTNVPAHTETITVNGDQRTWRTNVVLASTNLHVTNTVAWARSNLFSHAALYPWTNVTVSYSTTNAACVDFLGERDVAMTVAAATNWGTVTYATTIVSAAKSLVLPYHALAAAQRTNYASELVAWLNQVTTNTLSVSATSLQNFASASGAQTLGNKTLTNSALSGGSASNLSGLSAASVTLTNGWLQGFGLFATNLLGNLGNLTNGSLYSPTLSNATLHATSGYLTNLTGHTLTVTNLSVPGLGAGSIQLGASALASNDFSTAIGDSAQVQGSATYGVALGFSTLVTATNATAIGAKAGADGTNSLAVGYAAYAQEINSTALGAYAYAAASNSVAIGANATASHANAVAIGPNVSSSASDQVLLGRATTLVQVDGVLLSAAQTNAVMRGSNVVNGNLAFTAATLSTLAAGGNNVLAPTNVFLVLSGPLAAWSLDGLSPVWAGRYHVLRNASGYTATLKDESGFCPTPEQRIDTGGLGDVTLPAGALFSLWYDATQSRWAYLGSSDSSNTVAMYSTNLLDWAAGGATNNQTIVWDAVALKWTNANAGSAVSYTTNLLDWAAGGATNNQTIVWDAVALKWTNGTLSTGGGGSGDVTQSNVLYVAVDGSDTNAGTLGAPLATLARALTNAGNTTRIVLQPGTYTVTPNKDNTNAPCQILNKTNLVIEGYGAILSGSTNHGAFIRLKDSRNVTIAGLTVRSTEMGPMGPSNQNYYAQIVLVGTNANLTYKDMTLENAPNHGIAMVENYGGNYKSSDSVLVTGCRFITVGGLVTNVTGIQYDGTAIGVNGRRFIITDNQFTNCNRAVELEGTAYHPDGSLVLVHDNLFEHGADNCIMVFTSANYTNFSELSIANNVIRNYTNGIVVVGGKNVTIANNVIIGHPSGVPAQNNGIIVGNGTNAPLVNVLISGNQVDRFDYGISCNSQLATNVQIRGNAVRGIRTAPISVLAANPVVSDNYIVASTNTGSPFCIRAFGASGYPCTPVIQNNVYDGSGYSAWGLHIPATTGAFVSNAIVTGNRYIGTNADFLTLYNEGGGHVLVFSQPGKLGGSSHATYGGSNTFWDVYARTNIVIGPQYWSNQVAGYGSSNYLSAASLGALDATNAVLQGLTHVQGPASAATNVFQVFSNSLPVFVVSNTGYAYIRDGLYFGQNSAQKIYPFSSAYIRMDANLICGTVNVGGSTDTTLARVSPARAYMLNDLGLRTNSPSASLHVGQNTNVNVLQLDNAYGQRLIYDTNATLWLPGNTRAAGTLHATNGVFGSYGSLVCGTGEVNVATSASTNLLASAWDYSKSFGPVTAHTNTSLWVTNAGDYFCSFGGDISGAATETVSLHLLTNDVACTVLRISALLTTSVTNATGAKELSLALPANTRVALAVGNTGGATLARALFLNVKGAN